MIHDAHESPFNLLFWKAPLFCHTRYHYNECAKAFFLQPNCLAISNERAETGLRTWLNLVNQPCHVDVVIDRLWPMTSTAGVQQIVSAQADLLGRICAGQLLNAVTLRDAGALAKPDDNAGTASE